MSGITLRTISLDLPVSLHLLPLADRRSRDPTVAIAARTARASRPTRSRIRPVTFPAVRKRMRGTFHLRIYSDFIYKNEEDQARVTRTGTHRGWCNAVPIHRLCRTGLRRLCMAAKRAAVVVGVNTTGELTREKCGSRRRGRRRLAQGRGVRGRQAHRCREARHRKRRPKGGHQICEVGHVLAAGAAFPGHGYGRTMPNCGCSPTRQATQTRR